METRDAQISALTARQGQRRKAAMDRLKAKE
jgi:hypothetical protein